MSGEGYFAFGAEEAFGTEFFFQFIESNALGAVPVRLHGM